MENENPIVPDAQDNTQSTDGQAPQGVELRINQLVAEREEAKRQADALQAQLQQAGQERAQYLAMLERMAASQVQQPAAPEIDPAMAAAMQHYMKPMQEQFAQLNYQLQTQQAQMAFTQQAAQEDPRVVAQAEKLMAAWRRDSSKGGWAPQDALIMARGMLGIFPQAQNTTARNNMNAAAMGGLPNSPPPPAVTQKPVVELDRSSTDPNYLLKQAELAEKNLGDFEF